MSVRPVAEPTYVKIGRNEKCPCGSMKKFKVCCFLLDNLKTNQTETNMTPYVKDCVEKCKSKYPKKSFLDITEYLKPDNYVKYQRRYANTNTVLIAERNHINEKVFESRINNPDSNMIFLYNGSFRTCPFDQFDGLFSSICQMFI